MVEQVVSIEVMLVITPEVVELQHSKPFLMERGQIMRLELELEGRFQVEVSRESATSVHQEVFCSDRPNPGSVSGFGRTLGVSVRFGSVR